MSDQLQNGPAPPDKDPQDKHDVARHLADASVAARTAGDDARSDALMRQAERTDPQAALDALSEREDDPPNNESAEEPDATDSDVEVAAMSRTIEPGSAAPSRANITGSGSGADNS